VSPEIEDITLYIEEAVLGASTGLTRREAVPDAALAVLADQGNTNDFTPVGAFINATGNDRPIAERLMESDAGRMPYPNRHGELASTIDPSLLTFSQSIATSRSRISTTPSTTSSPVSQVLAPGPVPVLAPISLETQRDVLEEGRYACPIDKAGLSTSREHVSNCKGERNLGFQAMRRVRYRLSVQPALSCLPSNC
jgi:hypothetical protein